MRENFIEIQNEVIISISVGNRQTHLERIFILTGNDDVTFHNFHTFNPGKFHTTLQSPFFLKDREKHLVNANDCGLSE